MQGILDKAFEMGINFIDTANVYGGSAGFGRSEEIIGAWFDARPEVRDHESLLIGRDRQVRFGPVADAPGVLGQLLQTYRRGLLLPVHFFPECSLAYCRNMRTPHPDEHAALEAARQEWVDWKRERGGGLDPYNRLCHGEEPPLGAEFRKTAVEVFGPLLDHCEPVSTD